MEAFSLLVPVYTFQTSSKYAEAYFVDKAELGQVYLVDSHIGVVGCLSCGDFSGSFSPISRYVERYNNSDERSPCNPDTSGRARACHQLSQMTEAAR